MSSTASTEQTKQTAQVFQNFIAGQWRSSRDGETFVSTNPARTSEIIGYYQKSTVADLEEAIDAAAQAQRAWAATPAPERGEVLFRTALLLEQRKEELATLMTREMGKVLTEARRNAAGATGDWPN